MLDLFIVFLSTLSLRRATRIVKGFLFFRHISIHALLAESDLKALYMILSLKNFYPRSPCGERRTNLDKFHKDLTFLSTLSLRRATNGLRDHRSNGNYFYPRSPCGERRPMISETVWLIIVFLSTLSLRRATIPTSGTFKNTPHFYPRSPCGERPSITTSILLKFVISIHALLAESDDEDKPIILQTSAFLSTLSLRRATNWLRTAGVEDDISIHALLAESDAKKFGFCDLEPIFLSTLSLRRATTQTDLANRAGLFLSTLSLRRATYPACCVVLLS